MDMFRLGRLALGAGLLAICGTAVSVTQEEIDIAKQQKELDEARKASAEARKATAEAEAGLAKAKLGELDLAKSPRPSGEATNLHIEGNLLAYAAVDKISSSIANRLAGVIGSSPVVIYSEKEVNSLMQGKAFSRGLQVLSNAMQALAIPDLAADNETCAEPKIAGAGLGLLGSLDVALQVVSAFRVDKKVTGMDVTVDSFALASSVTEKLRQGGVTSIIYPPLFVAGAFDPSNNMFAGSTVVPLLDRLDGLQARMDGLLREIAKRREAIALRAKDAKKKPTPDCVKAFAEAKTVYEGLESRINDMKARAAKYMAAVITVDEKTGATLLQTLVQAERLAQTANGALVLQVKPIAAGGATLTKTSIFSTSFHFSGGAIVSYMLVRGSDGLTLSAGTVVEYGGFVEPKEMRSSLQVNPR